MQREVCHDGVAALAAAAPPPPCHLVRHDGAMPCGGLQPRRCAWPPVAVLLAALAVVVASPCAALEFSAGVSSPGAGGRRVVRTSDAALRGTLGPRTASSRDDGSDGVASNPANGDSADVHCCASGKTRSLASQGGVSAEDGSTNQGNGGFGSHSAQGKSDVPNRVSDPSGTAAASSGAKDARVRPMWPEFRPRHEARVLKLWRNQSKDTSPVLATADGSIRCWSDRDPRSFPRYVTCSAPRWRSLSRVACNTGRYQAFCFLESLCYMEPGKGKRQWFIPVPDAGDAGADLTPLTMQREIPTGANGCSCCVAAAYDLLGGLVHGWQACKSASVDSSSRRLWSTCKGQVPTTSQSGSMGRCSC